MGWSLKELGWTGGAWRSYGGLEEPGGPRVEWSLEELGLTGALGSYGGLERGGARVDWSLGELWWTGGAWRSSCGLEELRWTGT